MAVKFTNVSNPAAFGVEWIHEESGNRFQLVNIRGTTSLDFCAKYPDTDKWGMMRVFAPSRFGLIDPPKSFKQFVEIARRYVEE